MALMTSGIGGQPGTFTIGLSVITLSIGVAWVGLGRAACTQPQEAQVPQAIIAAWLLLRLVLTFQ